MLAITFSVFAASIEGTVIKVSDGDTITVQGLNNEKIKVRFYGVDAPEKKQEYGIKSLDVLKKKIDKKRVVVDVKDKDRYGRIVGVVYHEGVNVNLYMVETGNAWWYQQYAKNDKMLRVGQETAMNDKKGLWGEEKPLPPWEFRKKNKVG